MLCRHWERGKRAQKGRIMSKLGKGGSFQEATPPEVGRRKGRALISEGGGKNLLSDSFEEGSCRVLDEEGKAAGWKGATEARRLVWGHSKNSIKEEPHHFLEREGRGEFARTAKGGG